MDMKKSFFLCLILLSFANSSLFDLVGQWGVFSNPSKVEVSGNYAFLCARYNGTLSIIAVDISDSANPVMVAKTSIPNGAYGNGFEIIDTLICVSTSDNKLHIFDFDGDTLILRSTVSLPNIGKEVVGKDTFLYVAAYDSIIIIKISNPSAPVKLGGFDPSGNVIGLHLQDTMVFSTEENPVGGSRIRVFKISHPDTLTYLGNRGMTGYGKDVGGDYHSGYVFVADGVRPATSTGVMFSVDVSNPLFPDTVGRFQTPGASVVAIWANSSIAYLANDSLGVRVVNVSNPYSPTEIVRIPTKPDAVDVFAQGNFLYVLTDSTLRIYRSHLVEPVLTILSLTFSDSGDGDGLFEPGDTLCLRVILSSTGFDTVRDVWVDCSLLSGQAQILLPDSFFISAIAPGISDTNFFFVAVDTNAITPSQLSVLVSAHSSNDGNPLDTAFATIVSGTGGFFDDVESGINGWTATAHWHIDTWDASSPTHSWYCGGTASAVYGGNWVDTLISPWMKIPVSSSVIIVHHRYNVEDGYDTCFIDITGGTVWYCVSTFSTTTNGDWRRFIYQLSSFDPGDTFRIRFRFKSDVGVNGNGWWIDDIYLGPLPDNDVWGPRFFPQAVLEGDSVKFSITFLREDGIFPSSAKIYIGDSAYNLTTTDGNVSDGAIYTKYVRLPVGNYAHHYEFIVAGDTVRFPRTGEIDGPWVSDSVRLFWNFESDSHGVHTGCWQWGTPTSGPGSAHSGTKLWATNLTGNYPNNNQAILFFDTLDLTSLQHPFVQFWCWYQFDPRTSRLSYPDGSMAKIVTAAGDTLHITPVYEYPGITSRTTLPLRGLPGWGDSDVGNFWHLIQFNLSRWSGQKVTLRIDFGSNASTNAPGIYIDDLSLLGEHIFNEVLSFTLNGIDSAVWIDSALTRGEVLLSNNNDTIKILNTGNLSIDLGLKLEWWDTTYFALSRDTCYGCFELWGLFTNNFVPPQSSDYDSLDRVIDSLIFADLSRYGIAGKNIPQGEERFLWFKLRTPKYFPFDTLQLKILLKGMRHIE